MNVKDVDEFFMSDAAPEPPPDDTPAPVYEPPQNGSRNRKRESSPAAVTEQLLPYDEHAEKVLLGSILLDNDALKSISLSIDADDFFLDSHKSICLRMKQLFEAGRTIDIVTLSHELNKHKEVSSVGGISYLAALTEDLPRRPVIDDYIRIVAD